MRTITAEDGGFRIGAAVSGAQLGEHPEVKQAVAGRGRGGRADRLDPDPGPRHHGRQPVQRLARRRQRAGDDRGRRDRHRGRARTAGATCRSRRSASGPARPRSSKGEIVASVLLPARPPRSGDAYLRFIPRTEMDIAVVGAGVSLTLDDDGVCTAARVGLGAVAPGRCWCAEAAAALIGTKVDERGPGASSPPPRPRPAGRSTTSAARSNIAPRSPACWRGVPPRSRSSARGSIDGEIPRIDHRQRRPGRVPVRAGADPARRPARRAAAHRHQGRLRHRATAAPAA